MNSSVTQGAQKHDWELVADAPIIPFPEPHPPWSNTSSGYCDKLKAATASQQKHLQLLKRQHTNAWTRSWKTYQDRVIEPSIAQAALLDKRRLKTHSPLKKSESTTATPI